MVSSSHYMESRIQKCGNTSNHLFPSAVMLLLLHTVPLVLLIVGDWCQSCRHWQFCVAFSNQVHHTSAAVTSFNLRVVCTHSSWACFTATRIKERLVVVSQSSFIQLWKYVEHREREKKNRKREWWESSFNSSFCFGVFIPFISSPPVLHQPGPTGSHSSFPFLSSTLPPFHSGSLASCLPHSPFNILSFYPLSWLSCQKFSLHLWGLRVILLQLLSDLLHVSLHNLPSTLLTKVKKPCA